MSDAVEALRLGAADYLIKPLEDLAVLEHSVRRALDRARLLLENQRYRDKLEAANRELEASLHLLQEDQNAGRQVQMNMLPESPWASTSSRSSTRSSRRCTCRVISSTTSAWTSGALRSTWPTFPGMARRRRSSPCC
jgi:serine phosphatase RsbU (regulator of sigma subunit)